MDCKDRPCLLSVASSRESLSREAPNSRLSSVRPRHRRPSRALHPSRAHSRRKGEARAFRDQPRSRRLLRSREARRSKVRSSSHRKGRPSVSSRRRSRKSRERGRKVRALPKSQSTTERTSRSRARGRKKVRDTTSNSAWAGGRPLVHFAGSHFRDERPGRALVPRQLAEPPEGPGQ